MLYGGRGSLQSADQRGILLRSISTVIKLFLVICDVDAGSKGQVTGRQLRLLLLSATVVFIGRPQILGWT